MQIHRSRVFQVLLLWFAGLGAAAQFAKIAVPFRLIREAYPDAGSEIGWLLSLISLVGAILGMVAGDLVVRFGARRILILGLLTGAVIAFWQAFLPSYTLMLISRLLEGVSHLAIVVAAPTLIVRLSVQRFVGAAMALWSTFFGISFAIVAWAVIPLLGSGGIAVLFGCHGAFMMALCILVTISIPEPKSGLIVHAQPRAGLIASHIKAYMSPHISAPAAGWLLYTLTFVSLLALLPEVLASGDAAWAAGSMPLVSIAISLLVVPLLMRRLSSVTVIVIGFSLASAIVALNIYLDLQLVFFVALFAALGLVQGASFAAIPELNARADDQALAYGLIAQTGNIGNLLGTPLLLAIINAQGQAAMYTVVVTIYLVGIFLHLFLARRRAAERV